MTQPSLKQRLTNCLLATKDFPNNPRGELYRLHTMVAVAEGEHCPSCGDRHDLHRTQVHTDEGQLSMHYRCAPCACEWTMHGELPWIEALADTIRRLNNDR